MKKQFCSRDIEHFAIGMRLYLLPWEFMPVFFIAVHMPPSVNAGAVCDMLFSSCRHSSTCPLCHLVYPHLRCIRFVQAETIKGWTCCVPTPNWHVLPFSSILLGKLTITLSFCPLSIFFQFKIKKPEIFLINPSISKLVNCWCFF